MQTPPRALDVDTTHHVNPGETSRVAPYTIQKTTKPAPGVLVIFRNGSLGLLGLSSCPPKSKLLQIYPPVILLHSYWTWPFIVDLPIENGGSFQFRYVNVYQAGYYFPPTHSFGLWTIQNGTIIATSFPWPIPGVHFLERFRNRYGNAGVSHQIYREPSGLSKVSKYNGLKGSKYDAVNTFSRTPLSVPWQKHTLHRRGNRDWPAVMWGWVKTLSPWWTSKIAGKWMFIPLKMVLIGIDPYPCFKWRKLVSYEAVCAQPW